MDLVIAAAVVAVEATVLAVVVVAVVAVTRWLASSGRSDVVDEVAVGLEVVAVGDEWSKRP